jgi:hypothetical protein
MDSQFLSEGMIVALEPSGRESDPLRVAAFPHPSFAFQKVFRGNVGTLPHATGAMCPPILP